MTPSKKLLALASAGLLVACAVPVPVPTIEEQPKVSHPVVPLNGQTSVTGVASPTFTAPPAVPAPSNAEPSVQPVRSGVVTPIDRPAKQRPVVRAPAR